MKKIAILSLLLTALGANSYAQETDTRCLTTGTRGSTSTWNAVSSKFEEFKSYLESAFHKANEGEEGSSEEEISTNGEVIEAVLDEQETVEEVHQLPQVEEVSTDAPTETVTQ